MHLWKSILNTCWKLITFINQKHITFFLNFLSCFLIGFWTFFQLYLYLSSFLLWWKNAPQHIYRHVCTLSIVMSSHTVTLSTVRKLCPQSSIHSQHSYSWGKLKSTLYSINEYFKQPRKYLLCLGNPHPVLLRIM